MFVILVTLFIYTYILWKLFTFGEQVVRLNDY